MSPRTVAPRLPVTLVEPYLYRYIGEQHANAGPACVIADLTGVSRETAQRTVRDGLTWQIADRLAVALGYHPANLFGEEWWAIARAYDAKEQELRVKHRERDREYRRRRKAARAQEMA